MQVWIKKNWPRIHKKKNLQFYGTFCMVSHWLYCIIFWSVFFLSYMTSFFYIPLTNLRSTVSFILKCIFNVQQLKINFKHISPLKYHNIFLLSGLDIYFFFTSCENLKLNNHVILVIKVVVTNSKFIVGLKKFDK